MAKLAIKDLKMNVGLEGFDVDGVVDEVYPRRDKEGQYGKYTEQDLTISDGDGDNDKIQLRLRDHDEVPKSASGMEVVIKSKMNNKQKKMMGMKVKKDTWEKDGQEVSAIRLIASGSALVQIGEEDGGIPPEGDDGGPVLTKKKRVTPPPATPISKAQVYIDATEVIHEYLLTPAVKSAFQELREEGYTEETIRSFISGRVIEANRQSH